MFAVSDIFTSLHVLLLLGFIGVTSLLLLVTVVNWLRVRQPLMSWRSGRFLRLPGWPCLFAGIVLVLFGLSVAFGPHIPLSIFGGYLLGSAFWLVAASLFSSTVVTEHGLICCVNRADETVAWSQIVDYFEAPQGTQRRFVFFYLDEKDRRRRLELTVPASRRQRFREIVGRKLDARFDLAVEKAFGNKALEG